LQAHDEKLAGMLSGGQAVGAGRQERRPLFATSVFATWTVYKMVCLAYFSSLQIPVGADPYVVAAAP
jgi:hypothetical protein